MGGYLEYRNLFSGNNFYMQRHICRCISIKGKEENNERDYLSQKAILQSE